MAIEMTKPPSIEVPPAGVLLQPEPFISDGLEVPGQTQNTAGTARLLVFIICGS